MVKLPQHISILVLNFHFTQSPAPTPPRITYFSPSPHTPPKSSKNYSFFTQSPSPAQILQELLIFHPVPRPHGDAPHIAKGQKYAPPIIPQNNFFVILNFQCTQSPKSEQKKSAVLDLTADAEGKKCADIL